MIFGEQSDYKLKCAKAKAKATEFFADSSSAPNCNLNSDELHYTAVLTLSTYVNARLENQDASEYMVDLQKTGSFYDAASNDERYEEYSDGYWMLAMATYFLLGNFGSAKVCAEKVCKSDFYGDRAKTLHDLITFLLVPQHPAPQNLVKLADYLTGKNVSCSEVTTEARALVTDNNPEDAFFSRILYVSIIDALSHSARTLLPQYTNLSIDMWKPYLSHQKSPKLLWQAQKQIGEAGIFAGQNSFIQLPTGSGKTKSIELLLHSRILADCCRLAIIIAPLRALCSEITRDLSNALKEKATVKQASDVMEIDPWFEENAPRPKVIVFTPEKLRFVIHHNPTLLENSDLFVFDEVHLLDDELRGPGYELLLTEIFRSKLSAQKVLISAVVSNADKIAKWAFGNPNLITTGENIQVTEKSIGLIQERGSLISYVDQNDISSEHYSTIIDIEQQKLEKKPSERKDKFFPNFKGKPSDQTRDLAIYYANRILPNGACAVYVPQKKSLPPILKRLDELTQRKANIPNLHSSIPETEKQKLSNLIRKHYGEDSWLIYGIDAGVLPHYGDLQGAIRQAVEYEIMHGDPKCVVCTSTLAEGVNLPIKYLIITGARNGPNAPRTRDFQNLIGRTARAGKYSEGSVLLADDMSIPKNKKMYSTLMRESNTEQCESAIVDLLSEVSVREKVIPGESVIEEILNNLTNPQLEYDLAMFFESKLKCDETQAYALTSKKIRSLEAIESYLAGAIAANMTEVNIQDLCKSTYAYEFSNRETRIRLIKLFQAIYESLKTISKEQATLYHMMQLGTRTASSIIKWIESPEGIHFLEDGCSKIELLVQQFILQNPNIASPFNNEHLSIIIDKWISGANLSLITDTLNKNFPFQPEVKVEKIEKTVSKVVRFDFSHFISCVLNTVKQSDILSTIENIDALSSLQRKVKYGVSTLHEATICEEVIDDRMIAKEIVSIIGTRGPLGYTFLESEAHFKTEEIKQYANSLPTYCSKRILNWLKPNVSQQG